MGRMNKTLKLTVITVVYNAIDRIHATIDSVIGQDYDDIEYIIKDGGSTDGTCELVREIADKYGNVKYISGSDKGIYDAMNIALSYASGDAVEFLNAGDRFAYPDVVSRAMTVMRDNGSDIVYGDVLYENPDGTVNRRSYPQSCSNKLYFLTGDAINHQVMFVRRYLFDGNVFDTSFGICADREWMLRVGAYRPKCQMLALGFVVAMYPLDGESVINKERYKKEADICIRRYMYWGYPIYAAFELFRSNKILAQALHGIYKFLYFKKF